MNRTTLVGLVLAFGMITLGFQAVAEPQPESGPEPVFDVDDVDCNPTGYADYCPKSGNYLELDTMDVYYWDTGSSDVREEFRAPTLTNTGAKADAYFPYVWTWPYFHGDATSPTTQCQVSICPAAKVAVVGTHCVTRWVGYREFLYRTLDGTVFTRDRTDPFPMTCGTVVTAGQSSVESGSVVVCIDHPVATWLTFDDDTSQVGYESRDDVTYRQRTEWCG